MEPEVGKAIANRELEFEGLSLSLSSTESAALRNVVVLLALIYGFKDVFVIGKEDERDKRTGSVM